MKFLKLTNKGWGNRNSLKYFLYILKKPNNCGSSLLDDTQSGFTIIETLVAIILLGLVSTMSVMVFNQLWGNKAIMLKKETDC